jgi:hypothetical protein
MKAPPRILSASLESRRLSDLARVKLQTDGSSTEIFVKFHKHPQSPEARVRAKAQREFETLIWLREAFAAVPGCSVVRPVAYFSECKAVVTERADGANLGALLNRPFHSLLGFHRRREAGWCYQAGRWLRKFQTLTARSDKERFPSDCFWSEIDELIRRGGALGFPPPLMDQISSRFRSQLTRAGERELEVVGQHPDFQPQNILVGAKGITVLDFTSFKYGNRYHDVASFLTFLDSRSKHPAFRKARMEELQQSFLQGYRSLSLDDPILRLHRVREMLKYCASFLSRLPASASRKPVMRRFFLGWAEHKLWSLLGSPGNLN